MVRYNEILKEVDEQEIRLQLKANFLVRGSITLSNGLVNIKGDCNTKTGIILDKFPVNFGVIDGNFSCSNNRLTSLQGAPRKVTGHFFCHKNELTNLVGAPEIIGRNFYCYSNPLKSLKGLPKLFRYIKVDWTPDLPLLKLVGKHVNLMTNDKANWILDQHRLLD